MTLTTAGDFSPVNEDCAIFLMNGTGHILTYSTSKGETGNAIKAQLNIIKKRCQESKTAFLEYVFTDNAEAHVLFFLIN
jgi:hypothetical protein